MNLLYFYISTFRSIIIFIIIIIDINVDAMVVVKDINMNVVIFRTINMDIMVIITDIKMDITYKSWLRGCGEEDSSHSG